MFSESLIIDTLVDDMSITLMRLNILKDTDNHIRNYPIFAIKLEGYWNERVRDNPENFPYIRQERQKTIIKG